MSLRTGAYYVENKKSPYDRTPMMGQGTLWRDTRWAAIASAVDPPIPQPRNILFSSFLAPFWLQTSTIDGFVYRIILMDLLALYISKQT